MSKFKRADIVAALSPSRPLRCGSGVYDTAVVIVADPLVLVSKSGDMRWGSMPEEALHKVGIADTKQMAVCDRRLHK